MAKIAELQKIYRNVIRRSSETIIPPVDDQTKAELKIFGDDVKQDL